MADLARVAHVRGVTLRDDGIVIEYTVPGQDSFRNGLMFNHAVLLPDDAFEEVNATIRRVLRMAVAAAHDAAANPAMYLPADDDSDRPGPYEYPPGTNDETGADNGSGAES